MRKGRKISGGRYKKNRKKKKYELSGQSINVRLGDDKRKIRRVLGGNRRILLLKTRFVNVPISGKSKKAEIKNVLETPSNRFLARQNVLTKGAVIETELGKVRITSRPSQDGVVNGVLLEEKAAVI